MKKITYRSKRNSIRDAVIVLLFILFHYFVFGICFGSFFGIHMLTSDVYVFKINYLTWGLFYATAVGPLVNAMLQIAYRTKGVPWIRMVMWIHSIIIFVTMFMIFFVF